MWHQIGKYCAILSYPNGEGGTTKEDGTCEDVIKIW